MFCYCHRKQLDIEDADFVYRGIPVCSARCYSKAEEDSARRWRALDEQKRREQVR